jgi:hypothetical protein
MPGLMIQVTTFGSVVFAPLAVRQYRRISN